MKRCRWCGQFVAADTKPVTRTVYGYVADVLGWRTFTQVLCPQHRANWSTDSLWNRPTEEAS